VSTLDHMLEAKAVRRLEVITGSGGRRRFSDDEKARILEETLVPGAVVSAIARQHDLTPQQLFTWRRQARRRSVIEQEELAPFVPAVVDPAIGAKRIRRSRCDKRAGILASGAGTIEIETSGVTVRIERGADVKAVAAVMMALKAAR
jgi:transposase